jgi:hypothetical protein
MGFPRRQPSPCACRRRVRARDAERSGAPLRGGGELVVAWKCAGEWVRAGEVCAYLYRNGRRTVSQVRRGKEGWAAAGDWARWAAGQRV